MENKLKSKEKSLNKKNETISQDKNESQMSLTDIKNFEKLNKKKKNQEKKSKEKESLDLKDSTDIADIISNDDSYDFDNKSHEKTHKRSKPRRKKKKRKSVRNSNGKYKTSHKHRRVHKKRRHNKRKKHHRNRYKKYHKHKYIVLGDRRRSNFRGRSDQYSAERNSKHSSAYEDYESDNTKSLRKGTILAPMLPRNTRFQIVKNVRSGVSTPEQPSSNVWSYNKRYNVIKNLNMTIIGAGVDMNKTKQSVPNTTTVHERNKSNKHSYTADYSSSSSGTSAESNDDIPIDKWALTQRPMPIKASETSLIKPVKSEVSEIPLTDGKQKHIQKQLSLDNTDILNDNDYLSRKDEIIFSDWLKTVDRLNITTTLKTRRKLGVNKSTDKSKYTTKEVKPILFFKASDEYDSVPKIKKKVHLNKLASRRDNNNNPIVEFSLKPFQGLDAKIALDISLQTVETDMNGTDLSDYPYYQNSKRQRKSVNNSNIKITTKKVLSNEKRLVSNLAKQLRALEKINKNFEEAKFPNIQEYNKYNSTDVTQKFDLEKHLDMNFWIGESSKDLDNYKTDEIVNESRKRRKIKYLKDKYKIALPDATPGKTSKRKTIKNIVRAHHPRAEYRSINHDDNESLSHQTMSSEREPETVNQHSETTSFVKDGKVQFMSDEDHILPKQKDFETKRNRSNTIEWHRNVNNHSTFFPKQIAMKIKKTLSQMTNHKDPLRRQNGKFWDTVSESSEEERILKSNIYKYFDYNNKTKTEQDELNRNTTYVTKGNHDSEMELKNDTARMMLKLT